MTEDPEGAGPVRIGGIVVHRSWDGALSIIEHAKESIEILDSFFSDYNDLKRGIILAAGNGAKRLDIGFYLASNKKNLARSVSVKHRTLSPARPRLKRTTLRIRSYFGLRKTIRRTKLLISGSLISLNRRSRLIRARRSIQLTRRRLSRNSRSI
jgi:hypothetical protein